MMKLPASILTFFILWAGLAVAQPASKEIPVSWEYNLQHKALSGTTFSPNINALIAPFTTDTFHAPMLQGVSLEVATYFSEEATPTLLPDGKLLWQWKVHVPGAAALGVVISDFFPAGNEKLFIYTPDQRFHLGFSAAHSGEHGVLSTQTLPSEKLIIEYITHHDKTPFFRIDELIYIFPEEVTWLVNLKNSGSCNVNINCEEGAVWQKQKRGIVRILLRSGNTWYNCSGSLVNNTLQNGAPYLLTADHCGVNATAADLLVWQFYFNNEYPGCAPTGNLPSEMMLSGSTLLSRGPLQGGSDFKLLLLQNDIPLLWQPYFNGWSRFPLPTKEGVGIHHPSGDAKKISTYNTLPTTATFTGGMADSFWRMVWAPTQNGHGITEGGSSGSPLFDSNGLIIGTLTGGSASCVNTHLPDFYGKFDRHWQANGTAAERRLQPWLDPASENPLRLYGYDPNAKTNFVLTQVFPPQSGIILGDGYYAENETITITAIPAEGYDFKYWSDTLDNELSDQPNLTFTMPALQVTFRANFAEIQPNINEPDSLKAHLLYPNPAKDYVTIKLRNFFGPLQVVVVNNLGQRMRVWSFESVETEFTHRLDLSGMGAGIYFIQIIHQEKYNWSKLIIGGK